jgi:tetratricopeptide (TPR) repeat protein
VLASRSRVVTGKPTPFVLLLVCAALATRADAQVSAPTLVEEGEEIADETLEAERPARLAAPDVQQAPAPARGEAPPAVAIDAAAGSTPASALPPPPPPPTPAVDLSRQIVPVSTSWADLMRHWAERREALREQDPARAAQAEQALLGAKRELGIRNLGALAASEVRASARALAANLPDLALRHAEASVALGPDHADAHLALARARLALAPSEAGPILGAVRGAVGAAVREPHTLRAFQGDVAAAAFAAFFTAGSAAIVLLFLRRARLFLHDFHHLPLLSGSQSVQAGFLGLVLLAMPAAFGLGPFAILATLVLAAWLYLSRAERIVATVALAGLIALPAATGAVARAIAWTGTPAQAVFALEHGTLADEDVAELAARAEARPAPAAVSAALGRWHKRRGALAEAVRWYDKAAAADPAAPELQVNLGNVRFLQGDLQAAKASYLAASDRAGSDLRVAAAAHYGLAKLYLRASDMDKAAAARERAEAEDAEFLRENGADDDYSANRYLVDVPVPAPKIRALAAGDGAARELEEIVRSRLFGPLPRGLFPAAPAGFLAFLWIAALLARRLRPSTACERCGRAACVRCDRGAAELCGQCVNVFLKRGVVDARDRLRKESEVVRHARVRRAVARILALLAGGGGHLQLGAAGRGFIVLLAIGFAGFLMWFWRGVVPPPQPSPYVLAGKVAVALPVAVALWAWAVRDVFRRTR